MSGKGLILTINEAEMARIAVKLREMGKTLRPKERRDIIRPGAELVINHAKTLVPVSRKPHHRYKDGKLIATYFPGNLKRSLAILGHLGKITGNVFAGPKRAKNGTTGRFSGRRVDGYYMGIVEKKKPFLRPAFNTKKGEAEEVIIRNMKKALEEAVE